MTIVSLGLAHTFVMLKTLTQVRSLITSIDAIA